MRHSELVQQPPPPYSKASPQQNQSQNLTNAQRAILPGLPTEPYIIRLQEAIKQKNLEAFFPPDDPRIAQTAVRAEQQVERLVQAWRIPREIAGDFVRYETLSQNMCSLSQAD